MKKLVDKITALRVDYDVLSKSILQCKQPTQSEINSRALDILELPESANHPDIERKKQIMVDDVNDYGVILDVFYMLKQTVASLEFMKDNALLKGRSNENVNEAIVDARMLIKSIEDEE